MKTAIVLGSAGLIGSELVKQLQAAPQYRSILLLNRRPAGVVHSKIRERIIDFAAPDLAGVAGDDLYCALGTTRRQAGSLAAQQQVDYEYPSRIAALLRYQGVRRIFLVSSVGAKATATNFYLHTKGRLEKSILDLNFEQTVIVRPSFLIGHRTEPRRGEAAALLLLKLLAPIMLGPLRKYRGIEASAVAHFLVQAANACAPGVQIVESDKIREVG